MTRILQSRILIRSPRNINVLGPKTSATQDFLIPGFYVSIGFQLILKNNSTENQSGNQIYKLILISVIIVYKMFKV